MSAPNGSGTLALCSTLLPDTLPALCPGQTPRPPTSCWPGPQSGLLGVLGTCYAWYPLWLRSGFLFPFLDEETDSMRIDHPREAGVGGGVSLGSCKEAAVAADFPFWAMRLQNPSSGWTGWLGVGGAWVRILGSGFDCGRAQGGEPFLGLLFPSPGWLSRPDCWLEWRWLRTTPRPWVGPL